MGSGITVFSINSGFNTVGTIDFPKRPLLHIGQDEDKAGKDVAKALFDLGHANAACINDEPTNLGKAARCTAFDAEFLALGLSSPVDTTKCALTSGDGDFDAATDGSCASAVGAVATCAYVDGVYDITLDTCTSTLTAGTCVETETATPVTADTNACDAVTALDTNTACVAVQLAGSSDGISPACTYAQTTTSSDATNCDLTASADYGATPGTCAVATGSVGTHTCAPVAGSWTVNTADSCTATLATPTTVMTSGDAELAAANTAYATNAGRDAATDALLAVSGLDVLVTLADEVAIQVSARIVALTSTVQLATFDIDHPDIAAMLTDNRLILAVDQQPFLQGFLPVMFMTTFKNSGMKAENPTIKTGPYLLTDARAVAPYAAGEEILLKAETHGQGGDGFWGRVYLGSQQAAADMGINLDLSDMCNSNNAAGDLAAGAMATFINDAVALAPAVRPAGMLVSIPDADTLRQPLLAASAAGVAVVSLNSGYESAGSLGALTHVGMTEYKAGKMAGQYFVDRGHVSGLCLNHEPSNNAIIQRCAGFQQAFVDASLAYVNVDATVGAAFSANKATVVTALAANTGVDCILIGGESAKGYVVGAIEDESREASDSTTTGGGAGSSHVNSAGHSTIKAGTFDYSASFGDLITTGKLEFGIHQQEYYQGYVPVALLTLAQTRNLKVDESILLTGPAFITADQVAPRECELAPMCEVNAVANRATVLRGTFGANMEALEFAPAAFGMTAAGMLEIWDNAPVTATDITTDATIADGCLPLAAGTPGSAIIMDEGNCLFTTKARNAQDAGYGMVIIASSNADIPVNMNGVDAEAACAATDLTIAADVTTCSAIIASGTNAASDKAACEATGACTFSGITVPVVMVSQVDGDRMKADTSATYRITPYVITCPVGTFEHEFSCVVCPAGTYQDETGKSSCKSCLAGTYSKTLGAVDGTCCLACLTGSYQDETGQTSCKICSDTSITTTSGSTSCETCPANNATGVMVVVSRTCGLSLDTTAGTASDACDTNVPKTDEDDCYCTAGYFGEPGETCGACPTGGSCCSCMELYDTAKLSTGGADIFALETIYSNFEQYGRPCSSCLFGATSTETPPMPLPGFFSADPAVAANVFLPCVPEDACMGGPLSECATGYAGFRCGICADKYFRDSGDCSKCPTTPEWLVVLAMVLIVVFVLYALNAVSRWFRSGALAIALDWSQTIVIVSGFALNWPRELTVFSNVMSAFMFNTEYFAPECSVTTGYWAQWGMQLMLPFIVTGCFIGIYTFVRCKHQLSENGWSDNHAAAVGNAFVNAYFMFLSVFHPFLTKNSLEVFRCREFDDGKFYMDVQTSLECFDDEWYAHMPFAVLAFVVYGLGIPLLFFFVLRSGKNANRLDERMFKRRYGSIFIVYKKDAWYWECWIKSKKMLICIAMNLFPEATTYQGILAIIIMEVAIHMNMKRQPFRFKANNFVQKVASLNALAYLFSGLMFYSDKLDESGKAILINIMAVWIMLTAIWMVRSFMVEFVSYYGHWLITKRPSWAGFLKSAAGETLLKSKSALANSHWANTEELLDRYSKSLRTSQKSIEDGEGSDKSEATPDSVKVGSEHRRRSLVAIGDVGQSAAPEPSILLDLFFRDDALTVLAQWRETTDSAEDFNKLLSILTAVKGAGELIHMKMEMDKLDRIEAQDAVIKTNGESA